MLFLFHMIFSSLAWSATPDTEQFQTFVLDHGFDSNSIVKMETDNGNIDGIVDGIVDGKEANKNTVDIGLLVVHASSSGSTIDPKLRSLASHFENYKYTSYKLIKEHKDVMKDRKEKSYLVPGNKTTITITLLSHDAKRARVKIRILGANSKLLLDTTASVKRNGTFIVAGSKYKDGVLFLPITVKY